MVQGFGVHILTDAINDQGGFMWMFLVLGLPDGAEHRVDEIGHLDWLGTLPARSVS